MLEKNNQKSGVRMIINMGAPVMHQDQETAKVIIWRDRNPPKTIVVNVAQAVIYYPNESINNAIQALASEIFKFMEDMGERLEREKANAQHNNSGFNGYD